MRTYSFTLEIDGRPPEALEREHDSRVAAIKAARAELQGMLDAAPGAACAYTGVAEGAMSREDVEWLGAWDWTPEGGWLWSADD